MRKLLILFFFVSFLGFSQERRIFFGKTSDKLGVLPDVHIINTNTNQATSSNFQGQFKIFAKTTDTLKMTSVGYKTEVIILTKNDFGINEKQILLNKELIDLDEIKIKKHNLIGILETDIKNTKKPNKEVNAKTLKLPYAGTRKLTVSERRLYTAYGGGILNIDIIINLLSGRIKKLKKLKQIETTEKDISFLKNSFKNYIIQDLKIDTNNVSRFIYFVQENKEYNTVKNNGNFAIIKLLKEKAIEFKKLNKKE